MDASGGLVAVVHGQRDGGLVVTLLDRRRQRGAAPPTGTIEHSSPNHQYQSSQAQTSTPRGDTTLGSGVRCDSAIQVTDGSYASMYQTSHCNVTPTSPPVQLSEFPPQRPEQCPGHDNFQVGGPGSGDRCSPARAQTCRRGHTPWPDRGSECSSRTTHVPDAFADSLRKYPMMERSSEMIEKFINYVHTKNSVSSKDVLPVRTGGESAEPDHVERNSPGNNFSTRIYDGIRPKSRAGDSPTRLNGTRTEGSDYRRTFCNADVRYFSDLPRMVTRYMSRNDNSVNIDTQASVEMASRETSTAARADPSKNSVATSLSPCTSSHFLGPGAAVPPQFPLTSPVAKRKSTNLIAQCIQATSSSIELLTFAHDSNYTAAENARKCKSEENVKQQNPQDRMLHEFGNVTVHKTTNISNTLTKEEILKDMCMKLQRLSDSFDRNSNKENVAFNFGKKPRNMPVWIPRYDLKEINVLSGDLLNKPKKSSKMSGVFRAELCVVNGIPKENNIENVVKDWVNDIPIKHHDFIGRPVESLQVTDALKRKLLKLFSNKSRHYDIPMLKRKIINIITEAPLDMSAYKRHYLIFRLVDSLIDKVKEVSPQVLKKSNSLEAITNRYNHNTGFVYTTNKMIKLNEKELTDLLFKELEHFKEKSNLNLSCKTMKEIILELIDILIESTDDIRFDNNNSVNEEIVMFLSDTGLFSSQEANCFAKHLLEQLRIIIGQTKTKWSNRNFVVLENTLIKIDPQATLNESSEIRKITQNDVNRNLEAYVNELCSQIDEWLTNLSVTIPEVNDKSFRQGIIKDLAEDIVDRHKYLEITNSHKENECEEIEYLKYQIYKWIKKLIGEEQKEIISQTPDLLKIIRNIPVPIINKPNQSTNNNPEQKQSANKYSTAVDSSSQAPALQQNNQVIPRDSLESFQTRSSFRPTVNNLNEEYDDFLKKWIQKIPIPITNYIDQDTADKARIGIYNGIWKAVTKLKFYPEIFHNQFYYQDILDDEIEKLLDALPKTDELDSKKHSLKLELIEKTINTNEMIKRTAESASFKQQLLQNILNNLRRQTITDNLEDCRKFNEELQILNIVENYILCISYKEEDKDKADVYHKKLLNDIKVYVDQLKKSNSQELKNIDSELYMTNILNALHKMPLPSEEILIEERDQILLGTEIEGWLSELPIVPNDNQTEQLQRRRLRDALGKKIFEIHNNNNIREPAVTSAIKLEVSRFLLKLPLQHNESLNTDFIVGELTNRMKNKAMESRKKSVTFQEIPCYDQFGQNLNLCSSFNAESGRMLNQATPQYSSRPQFQSNISEYGQYHSTPAHKTDCAPSIIVGGGLATMPGAVPDMPGSFNSGYVTFDQNRPISSSLHNNQSYNRHFVNQTAPGSSNQPEPIWYTLEETKFPYYGEQQSMQTQQQTPQQYYSMYVNETNGQSNQIRQVHDENRFNIQKCDNIDLGTSQIAAGHAGNQVSDKSDIANNKYQGSTAHSAMGIISPEANNCCPHRLSASKYLVRPADNQLLADKSCGHIFPITVPMLSLKTMSHQTPSSPRIITGTPLRQIPNGIPENFTPRDEQRIQYQRCAQLPVPNNLYLTENVKPQQYLSSYGQPQGFSTPQQDRQEINGQCPPRVSKKRGSDNKRTTTGLIRRRLDLDDSDFEEEEGQCHCMRRMFRHRRPCYDDCYINCPYYMPLPFPCPYFF